VGSAVVFGGGGELNDQTTKGYFVALEEEFLKEPHGGTSQKMALF
jgi:hypothetical protein